jgi:hypothetical protein
LRRDELFEAIEKTATLEDLEIGKYDAQGRACHTFRISNGQVPLGPNSGERLVNFLLTP